MFLRRLFRKAPAGAREGRVSLQGRHHAPGDLLKVTITRAPSSEALTGRLELRPFDSIESTQLFGHPLASLNVTLEAGVDTLELSLTVPLDALTRPREEHELPVEGSGWELGWMVGNVTVSHCPVHLAAAPTPPPGTDDERRGQG